MHHHPAKKTNGPDQDVGAEPSWTFPEEQDAERPALVGEARDPSWPSSFLAFSSLPKGRHTEKPLLHTPGSFCSPCSLPAAPSTALSKNMAEKWEGPKIASHSGLHELQIPLQNHFSSKRRKEIHLQSPPRSGNHLSVYVWFQGISQFLSFDHKLHLFIPLSHRWHLLHPPFNHTTMGKAICY